MWEFKQGGFLISKIHQLAGRIFSKKLKERGITEINAAQGRILFFLWRNDGISIQQVSKATSLEKSTLTSMLDRLEAEGHIKRVPSAEDRRKILIHVTDKNTPLKGVYAQIVQEVSDIFYSGFSENEINEFESGLHRIFGNLSKYDNDN